jgi:DNA-binding transcriptional ArsR family regulator
MTYATTLAALADPTRRAVYERVRRRPQAVGELARALAVSQPAVSQHLKVLRSARLVRARHEGTRRIYSADTEGLADLRRYVDQMWDDALAAYAATASEPPPARRARARPAK